MLMEAAMHLHWSRVLMPRAGPGRGGGRPAPVRAMVEPANRDPTLGPVAAQRGGQHPGSLVLTPALAPAGVDPSLRCRCGPPKVLVGMRAVARAGNLFPATVSRRRMG
jgi:hypothetical protein